MCLPFMTMISQIKNLKRNVCKLLGHEYKYIKSPAPIPNVNDDYITIGACTRCFKRMRFKMDWFNEPCTIREYDKDFPKESL